MDLSSVSLRVRCTHCREECIEHFFPYFLAVIDIDAVTGKDREQLSLKSCMSKNKREHGVCWLMYKGLLPCEDQHCRILYRGICCV